MFVFHSTTTFVAFPPDAVVTIPELLLLERNWIEEFPPALFPAYTAEEFSVLSVQLEYDVPVIFGLITTNNLLQAQERSGGRLGNKGDECAVTALHMMAQFKHR